MTKAVQADQPPNKDPKTPSTREPAHHKKEKSTTIAASQDRNPQRNPANEIHKPSRPQKPQK
jgi:hypothetical protein